MWSLFRGSTHKNMPWEHKHTVYWVADTLATIGLETGRGHLTKQVTQDLQVIHIIYII